MDRARLELFDLLHGSRPDAYDQALARERAADGCDVERDCLGRLDGRQVLAVDHVRRERLAVVDHHGPERHARDLRDGVAVVARREAVWQ
jgi:hypothetical protein